MAPLSKGENQTQFRRLSSTKVRGTEVTAVPDLPEPDATCLSPRIARNSVLTEQRPHPAFHRHKISSALYPFGDGSIAIDQECDRKPQNPPVLPAKPIVSHHDRHIEVQLPNN